MKEFMLYDQMMASYYESLSNVMLPLASWEFYGEHSATLQYFKEDFEQLSKITNRWDFDKNLVEELVVKKSVVVVTSTDLRIVYASKNMVNMNGYMPKEVIGQSPKMFQGKDTCQKTSRIIREAINQKTPFEVQILNYRKDKEPYMCYIKGFPVMNKKGKLLNYIAFEKAA